MYKRKQPVTIIFHNSDEKRTGKFSFKNLLPVLQSLSVLFTLFCAVFIFFRFDTKEKEFKKQLDDIELKKSKLNYETINSERFSITENYELKEIKQSGNSCNYFLIFNYSFLNKGDKRIEISYVIVNIYSLRFCDLKNRRELCFIPDFKHPESKWMFVTSKGYYISSKWEDNKKYRNQFDTTLYLYFNKGGGGTARLDREESSGETIEIILTAIKYDMIGIELRVGLDDGKTADNRWYLSRHILLNKNSTDSNI